MLTLHLWGWSDLHWGPGSSRAWVRTGTAVFGSGETPQCLAREEKILEPPDRRTQKPSSPSCAAGNLPPLAKNEII